MYLSFSTENHKPVMELRYIKISDKGDEMFQWDGPWACVLDKQQNLLWEVKTDSESIHDGYWTYSWFDGVTGTSNSGDCYFETNRCDTLDLVRKSNQQKLCGITGWRLPSRDELTSLFTDNDRPRANKIATDYFPQIKNGDYWTSTNNQPLAAHYRHLKVGAIAVNFNQQSTANLPYRNAAFVLLVNDNIKKITNKSSKQSN